MLLISTSVPGYTFVITADYNYKRHYKLSAVHVNRAHTNITSMRMKLSGGSHVTVTVNIHVVKFNKYVS